MWIYHCSELHSNFCHLCPNVLLVPLKREGLFTDVCECQYKEHLASKGLLITVFWHLKQSEYSPSFTDMNLSFRCLLVWRSVRSSWRLAFLASKERLRGWLHALVLHTLETHDTFSLQHKESIAVHFSCTRTHTYIHIYNHCSVGFLLNILFKYSIKK